MAKRVAAHTLLKKIKVLTRDLNMITAELSEQSRCADAPHGREIFLEARESLEIAKQLKAAVDGLRHILWLHIEKLAERPRERSLAHVKLLERALEMLYVLSGQSVPRLGRTSSGASFLDHLLTVVEEYVDLGSPEGKRSHNGTEHHV